MEARSRQPVQTVTFASDTQLIADEVTHLLMITNPSLCLPLDADISNELDQKQDSLLKQMTFYKITRCTVEEADEVFETVQQSFAKLLAALYSLDISIGYGIVSENGSSHIILGVSRKNENTLKSLLVGTLSGITLESCEKDLLASEKLSVSTNNGIILGEPSLKTEIGKNTFSLASIMRALNGRDYLILFLAKPESSAVTSSKISELTNIKDKAFAVSKRTIANEQNKSATEGETSTDTTGTFTANTSTLSTSHSTSSGFNFGASAGLDFIISVGLNLAAFFSRTTAMGYSNSTTIGKNFSTSLAKSLSQTYTEGTTISGEQQNGFALSLMNYAEQSSIRMKNGLHNGVWKSSICYVADSPESANILHSLLFAELAKPVPDKFPLRSFRNIDSGLPIPKLSSENSLCSFINTDELSLLFTLPKESVPNFELRTARQFPLLPSSSTEDIPFGFLTLNEIICENLPFGFSYSDLNKHTFVCGMTGSGKTNTVKKILSSAKKPFLVIEPAKKEYRCIELQKTVFTPGRPTLNSPRINPFYIMPGIPPQLHIDYLKDLFTASFGFYQPMPAILEQCLQRIYINKGWNLELGTHPLIIANSSIIDLLDIPSLKKRCNTPSYKFLFPTMFDLKNEITRYIENDLAYSGEVAGNIKTAMKTRLAGLCSGAKGYMFNTIEHINMVDMLQNNTVFELEGLADDADKAFCLGLLIILINEYRRIEKEIQDDIGLRHLLVIEEAHRLLKNTGEVHNNEIMGDPQGKAIEHFTNLIAEMRSYGQGVIIAEQIPSKLAPEVIKNTSNKIVQRLVAFDDQHIMANTIGIADADMDCLGTIKCGYALCHKEGMKLPVSVAITEIKSLRMSDESLYQGTTTVAKIDDYISLNKILELKPNERFILGLLNSLLLSPAIDMVNSVKKVKDYFSQFNETISSFLIDNDNFEKFIPDIILYFIIQWMISTNYIDCKFLPDEKAISLLKEFLIYPLEDSADQVRDCLRKSYPKHIDFKLEIAQFFCKKKMNDSKLDKELRRFFMDVPSNIIDDIKVKITRLSSC